MPLSGVFMDDNGGKVASRDRRFGKRERKKKKKLGLNKKGRVHKKLLHLTAPPVLLILLNSQVSSAVDSRSLIAHVGDKGKYFAHAHTHAKTKGP